MIKNIDKINICHYTPLKERYEYMNKQSEKYNIKDKLLFITEYDIIKNLDYIGNVCNVEGNRLWHIGKCSKDNIWNNKEYSGIYVPWCRGGYGYMISRNAINLIKNDSKYKENIYEDLYIAILLKNNKIYPTNFSNWRTYCISHEHII